MKRHRSPVLSAGGAPSCWQRDLTRQTARTERLQRVCNWLKPLAENHLKLRDKHLWGHCLTELTDQAVPTELSSPETSQLQHNRTSWPDREEIRERALDRTDKPPVRTRSDASHLKPSLNRYSKRSSVDHLSNPAELKRQVSQNLLNELSGETLRDTGKTTSVKTPSVPAARLPGSSVSDITRDAMSQRNWLHNIARRAGHSLGKMEFHPVSALLDEQWSIGLDGEPAPAELLIRWVRAPAGNGARPGRQVKLGTRSRPLSGVDPNQPQSTLETASSRSESTRAPLPVTGWAGNVESQWISPDRIAPPVLTPSLPRLLTSQGTSEPAPALAAMITRQDSRREALPAEEDDLTGLAANLKRILEEEARRHGIDV